MNNAEIFALFSDPFLTLEEAHEIWLRFAIELRITDQLLLDQLDYVESSEVMGIDAFYDIIEYELTPHRRLFPLTLARANRYVMEIVDPRSDSDSASTDTDED